LALWFWSAYFDSTTEKFDPGSHQTDIDRALHLFDSDGVPILKIEGVGEQRHPAWIAIYALAYAGAEVYDDKLLGLSDKNKFEACIRWLTDNLRRKPNGLWAWEYGFDSTYNDVSIKAPWSSAFAQATGIQALLAAYRLDGRKDHLELAKKAAQPLFVAIREGGLLFESGDDIWFEEIPAPPDNPTHILNGHMRVLLALRELADITLEPLYEKWFLRGVATLERWLPRFDAGYWLRYDLNPRKRDLLFRFANPYGFSTYSLAVDRIVLRDPVTKQEVVLDVGEVNSADAEGQERIAGTHWGQEETVQGRSVRRLVVSKTDVFDTVNTYFYLSLPGKWTDNLRDQEYELIIEYFDEQAAALVVQIRSIAPGAEFQDMRDGDLMLSGIGHWRRWSIPIRPSDLGFWVGESYADKHVSYLKKLAPISPRIAQWTKVAEGYRRAALPIDLGRTRMVKPELLPSPKQTSPRGFSLDSNGVLMMYIAGEKARLDAKGIRDATSDIGHPVYSPYLAAIQVLLGPSYEGFRSADIKPSLSDVREPGLAWLLSLSNQVQVDQGIVFPFKFENAYNDITTAAPWASAFGQAYVVKALCYAAEEMGQRSRALPLLSKVIKGYEVKFTQGGITSFDRSGRPFFEEVPNATHVLNAHLVSINEIAAAERLLAGDHTARRLVSSGIASIRQHLSTFDTGYWLKYDQNPRKEILFQIDWLSGEQSFLIEDAWLENPETGSATWVDVGSPDDGTKGSRISGTEWMPEQMIDGRSVRGFVNGYEKNRQSAAGGTRHNVYLVMRLPEPEFEDWFDFPTHRLIIRYKDRAPGDFLLGVQAINSGNQLRFVPLRQGVLHLRGDGQWKTAVVPVRPQDMGWYKGPDYQQYEVEQLERIAHLTGDWFFSQYAERHRYFLEANTAGKAIIIQEDSPRVAHPLLPSPKIVAASPTYPGHGFDNALDGNAVDDYTAALENQPQAFVTLDFGTTVCLGKVEIDWENSSNFAKQVVVTAVDKEGTPLRQIGRITAELIRGQTRVPIANYENVRFIRIDFSDFAGQPRLLLRQLTFWGKVSE
jgi:hypothetical protein